MTINQTIDGVPRELLEKALIDAMGSRARHSPHIAQLRALLDAPVKKRPTWMDEPFAVAARGEERGSSHGFEQSPNTCRHDERAGVWWREGSVTRTGREFCACGNVEEDPVKAASHPQGEPVAIIERARKIEQLRAAFEQRFKLDIWPVIDWLRNSGLYTEQPAPVAVVLPERLNHADGLHTYEYVTGHNAAIDKMLK